MGNRNAVVTFTLKSINEKTSLIPGDELQLNSGEVGPDMFCRLAGVEQKDGLKMSTRDVMVNLSSTVFVALRVVIYYLCKNPSTMKKLVDELDVAESRLSSPVTYKEATNLPYLQAVLRKECISTPAWAYCWNAMSPPTEQQYVVNTCPEAQSSGSMPGCAPLQPEIIPATREIHP